MSVPTFEISGTVTGLLERPAGKRTINFVLVEVGEYRGKRSVIAVEYWEPLPQGFVASCGVACKCRVARREYNRKWYTSVTADHIAVASERDAVTDAEQPPQWGDEQLDEQIPF